MKTIISFCIVILFSATAFAQQIEYDKLCGKLKQCALKEISNTGEIPPGTEQIIEQMFDSQCASMLSSYTQKFDDANLNGQASACADSIYELSCDELMASQGEPTTEACKDFEKAAEEAGIDLRNIDQG